MFSYSTTPPRFAVFLFFLLPSFTVLLSLSQFQHVKVLWIKKSNISSKLLVADILLYVCLIVWLWWVFVSWIVKRSGPIQLDTVLQCNGSAKVFHDTAMTYRVERKKQRKPPISHKLMISSTEKFSTKIQHDAQITIIHYKIRNAKQHRNRIIGSTHWCTPSIFQICQLLGCTWRWRRSRATMWCWGDWHWNSKFFPCKPTGVRRL